MTAFERGQRVHTQQLATVLLHSVVELWAHIRERQSADLPTTYHLLVAVAVRSHLPVPSTHLGSSHHRRSPQLSPHTPLLITSQLLLLHTTPSPSGGVLCGHCRCLCRLLWLRRCLERGRSTLSLPAPAVPSGDVRACAGRVGVCIMHLPQHPRSHRVRGLQSASPSTRRLPLPQLQPPHTHRSPRHPPLHLHSLPPHHHPFLLPPPLPLPRLPQRRLGV